MTVASLWKALDRAGCGKPVGIQELQEHLCFHERTNPWNVNDQRRDSNRRCPTLAVDLSIWICEALTCSAFEKSKTDPSLQLVYTRTVKLLSLGFKLVMVIEGKRRTRHHDGLEDTLRKRRSGTFFWNSCQKCEHMLRLLGVPVVRAKAEGEALCALLNHKGIVDGVISNDGDCFLFGAKVLYTKFTLENLEKKMVMRYDACDIRACVDDDDGNEYDNEREPKEIVSLDRSDLIAFAILTGSDAVGAGLPKVGCRKAIRFIKKCQLDNPLRRKDAAINELKSWARSVHATKTNPMDCCNHEDSQVKGKQTCSCCGHSGTKAMHKKHGCTLCGTEPGESCFALSPGAKFRTAMRNKAMSMEVDFDPESVVEIYQNPNDNQIPLSLLGKTSTSLQMAYPNFEGFQNFPMVVRGQNLFESRQYLKQSLSSLMARNEVLKTALCENTESTTSRKLPTNKTRPEPRMINKTMVRGGKPSFEVEWIVKATVTDAEGNSMDEFVFCTIEDQQMVKKRYPKLIEEFETQEKERAKQGVAEQEKRRAFLELLCAGCDPKEDPKRKSEARKLARRCFREDDHRASIGVSKPARTGKEDELIKDPTGMEISFVKQTDNSKTKLLGEGKVESEQVVWGDDANKLLRFVGVNTKKNTTKTDGCTSMCTDNESIATMDVKETDDQGAKRSISLTPGHLHFLGSKRRVKLPKEDPISHSQEDPISDPLDDGACFKENHRPQDIQPRRVPIQSTVLCRKECCTNKKELIETASLFDESSVVLRNNKNHNIRVRKREKTWLLSARNSNAKKKRSHSDPATYPQDVELKPNRALFQTDRQLVNYEPLEEVFDLGGIDNETGEHWKSHHSDSFITRKSKFPSSGDYIVQPRHRPKIPQPEEDREFLIHDHHPVSQEYHSRLDSNPPLDVGYTEPSHCYGGQQICNCQDYSATRKRQKIEFGLWDSKMDFLLVADSSGIHDTHRLKGVKVSRPLHIGESDIDSVPKYTPNDDLFNFSRCKEEEQDELRHSNMQRSYPEFSSSDNMLRFFGQSDGNFGHSQSTSSFSQHQLFQDTCMEDFSTGKEDYCSTFRELGSNVGNQNKVTYRGLLEDAVAEKLRMKISQAALEVECSRQFQETWL